MTAEYDARNRTTSQTDQNGNTTSYEYDGADRLTRVTDAYGNSYAYTYDGNGNMVAVTDALGHVTHYTYDAAGHVEAVTDALGRVTSYTYDATGNLARVKDHAGNVTEYQYDRADRIKMKKTGADTTEYVYNGKGLLKSVTDSFGTIRYRYDEYNRLTEKTDARGHVLSYAYDSAGRLAGTDSGKGATKYRYDAMDRLTRVISRDGKATVYAYDKNGNRSKVTYANGVTLTYTYDACQRLKEECVTDASGKQLAKYAYGLGKAGERLAVTETDADGSRTDITYTYDKLNRLTREAVRQGSSSLINEYAYDAVSNRTSRETTVKGDISKLITEDAQEVNVTEGKTEYVYNALNQLVTERTPEGDTVYTYDRNGNLTEQAGAGGRTRSFTYDAENRLLDVTVQEGNSVTTESYAYDYEGNRTSRQVNEGAVTYYAVDTNALSGLAEVAAETDADGKATADYVRGDELVSIETGKDIHYYVQDGHGSVRFLTDQDAEITDTYSYDAYGNLLIKEGDTQNDYLYTGEQHNANTGLYYLRARYMDPSTGTFITMDSYQGSLYDPVTLHKYLYANADPVMNTDPTGYFSLADCSVAQGIQSTLNTIHNIQSLQNIVK